MMVKNLPPQTLYDFIVNDFEDAWDSLAANPTATGRGNFMFARQAMALLEFAARLCASDKQGAALRDLSAELDKIEPKYFTVLPGPCYQPPSDFALPSISNTPHNELLLAMFDMVRNGGAHQYQQIVVPLTDGKEFAIFLTGAAFGRHLGDQNGRSEHLAQGRDSQGDLCLLVHPDVLFLDLKGAIAASRILNRGLSFDYLTRPRHKPKTRQKALPAFYQFSSTKLENSLASVGHPPWVP